MILLHNTLIRILRLIVFATGTIIGLILFIPLLSLHIVIGIFWYILTGKNLSDCLLTEKTICWPLYFFIQFADNHLIEIGE